jgi:hypothetical protein
MSIPDALAAFAAPPTTTVTILEINTGAILDGDVWRFRYPSGLSIHPSRKTSERLSLSKKANARADRALSLSKTPLLQSTFLSLCPIHHETTEQRNCTGLLKSVFVIMF